MNTNMTYTSFHSLLFAVAASAVPAALGRGRLPRELHRGFDLVRCGGAPGIWGSAVAMSQATTIFYSQTPRHCTACQSRTLNADNVPTLHLCGTSVTHLILILRVNKLSKSTHRQVATHKTLFISAVLAMLSRLCGSVNLSKKICLCFY